MRASPRPRRLAWLALMSLFPLLCEPTDLIPIAQAHHRPPIPPSTSHRRELDDDGGGDDGACRTARARVAQHSSSMPLQRALMDTLNASRAHQYATGLGALFLQVKPAAQLGRSIALFASHGARRPLMAVEQASAIPG